MDCPRCQRENPPLAKFCVGCAAPFALNCRRCGAPLPPEAKFCPECAQPVPGAEGSGVVSTSRSSGSTSPKSYTPKHLAEKILTSRSALEGERKQVTVLFVDVSGFTSFSERLDPEDIHRLMTRAFELMLTEVHRYEGTVNQFLGDGIMALFGAPIAHEDHARRAVHAALGILRALDGYRQELEAAQAIGFHVRQGINTGLVVVGSIGTDLRMDYTAVGDTTNVAARLQQVADRGLILVSGTTHRLVAPYFYTRPLGQLSLKGKSEPVPAWEVVSARPARTRLDVEAERGLTPYVGREQELRLLQECFERARAGNGQVAFVVGEPGIGKSRLLYEFRQQIGEEATWLEGRCISFGRSIALHPVVDMLKRNFRIEEADSEATIASKIEQGVIPLGGSLRSLVPYLRYLLSVDPGDPAVLALDAQLRRAELFDALRQLLVTASQTRPQIMVVEDLQWIDQASEESLLHCADSIPGCRILQILTYRPGYNQPFGERSYHTRIALTTLSRDDSVRMAHGMLAAESLPEDLKSLITRKAEGNPFFVEEVVKSLQEVGVIREDGARYVVTQPIDKIVMPDTIQDVIMARIDRLADAPKKTLQLASVIGREFTRRLLDRIGDTREHTEGFLRELKAIELIYEKTLFPELAYMFKHALTHDVAYNSLLVQRRRDLHGLIGLAIEELYAERLSEHYEVLAHHFALAHNDGKALDYLLKSAEKAAKDFANREALAFYDQALGIASRLGNAMDLRVLLAIREAKANIFIVTSDFDKAYVENEHVAALARQLEDRVKEGAALAGMGFAALYSHQFDRALADCAGAIAIGEETGASAIVHSALFTTGYVHTAIGQLEAAQTELQRVLTGSRASGDRPNEFWALVLMGFHRNWQGRYRDGLSLLSEALEFAREQNLVFPLLNSLWGRSLVLIGKGDYEAAFRMLQEAETLSARVGDVVVGHRIQNTFGWLHNELGNVELSLDYNRRGAEYARGRGDAETLANAELNFADAALAKGDLALAQDALRDVHGLVHDTGTSEWQKWRYSIHLFASLAEAHLAGGERGLAQRCAEQCLERASRTNSRRYLARGWRVVGEIAIARRQWADADRALRQALTIAEAIGNPTQLWKTHRAAGRLHDALKKPDAARESYGAACDVINRTRSNLQQPTLRAGLESSLLVRELYDLAQRRSEA
jgi:class 3 adenylate cyclase/tetratricopeptide (TPR) repeat protein